MQSKILEKEKKKSALDKCLNFRKTSCYLRFWFIKSNRTRIAISSFHEKIGKNYTVVGLTCRTLVLLSSAGSKLTLHGATPASHFKHPMAFTFLSMWPHNLHTISLYSYTMIRVVISPTLGSRIYAANIPDYFRPCR